MKDKKAKKETPPFPPAAHSLLLSLLLSCSSFLLQPYRFKFGRLVSQNGPARLTPRSPRRYSCRPQTNSRSPTSQLYSFPLFPLAWHIHRRRKALERPEHHPPCFLANNRLVLPCPDRNIVSDHSMPRSVPCPTSAEQVSPSSGGTLAVNRSTTQSYAFHNRSDVPVSASIHPGGLSPG